MGGQSGLSELSVISWVSTVEGCPLSGVPMSYYTEHKPKNKKWKKPRNEAVVSLHVVSYPAVGDIGMR